MPRIKFRDKEYNSLADMPAKVRHDYFKARAGYDVSEKESESKSSVIPSGLEKMPGEVREIYERVQGKIDAKPVKVKTSPVDELPSTEDLYRRSAPEEMQNQPSDEIIYTPSPPLIEPTPLAGETDQTLQRMVIGLAIVILLVGIVLGLYLGG